MALFEYLSMAFASIKSNKMRSLLTMLGVALQKNKKQIENRTEK